MERVFDICHGCRRCVSLCQSFPTLFDLVDATADGEVHGVDKKDYWSVVDQCYLCDLCYMTKCPYVPPHPWNVDFPHLMLRAKAIKFSKGEVGAGEKLLASTDVHGQLRRHPDRRAGGQRGEPDRSRCARCCRRRSACTPMRGCPTLATQRFRWSARRRSGARYRVDRRRAHARARWRSSRPATSTTTSRASATTCSKVLEHNAIPYVIVEKESCCGMPKLELGDLEGVARLQGTPTFRCSRGTRARATRSVTRDPVVHADVQAGAAADVPGRRRRQGGAGGDVRSVRVPRRAPSSDGLLKTDFKRRARQGQLSHPLPRPGAEDRPQDRGDVQADRPDGEPCELNTVERCSGHAGTYGVKTPTHPVAMKIGKPVFKAMAQRRA